MLCLEDPEYFLKVPNRNCPTVVGRCTLAYYSFLFYVTNETVNFSMYQNFYHKQSYSHLKL